MSLDVSFLRQFSSLIQAAYAIRGKTIEEVQAWTSTATASKAQSYFAIRNFLKKACPNDGLQSLLDYADITLKTIALDEKGRPTESMSFSAFEFCKVATESWESSSVQAIFSKNFWFFVTYQKGEKNVVLTDFFWQLSKEDLASVQCLYESYQRKLLQGEVYVKDKNGAVVPAFRLDGCRVSHIRPHAANKEDTSPLPVADRLTGRNSATKQSFWLDKAYLEEIVRINLSPVEKEVIGK